MIKITLDVEGMACGMCEAHINDAIRQNFRVKKVISSRSKKTTEIIADEAPDEGRLRSVIGGLGYTVTAVQAEPYEKKKFSLFRK